MCRYDENIGYLTATQCGLIECAKLRGLRGLRGSENLRGSLVVSRGSWVNLRGSWVLSGGNFAWVILRG